MSNEQYLSEQFWARGYELKHVTYIGDESIQVQTVDHGLFTMTIGSDDDQYLFRSTDGKWQLNFDFQAE